MLNQNNDVLNVNPILEALAQKGPGRVVELKGFIGPSDATVVRLHESLEMVSYLEIPRSEVLHAVADPKSTNGAVKLYVLGNTEILSVSSQLIRADARISTSTATKNQTRTCGCGNASRVIRRFKEPGLTTADVECKNTKRLIDYYQDCLDNDSCQLPGGGRVQLNDYLRDYIQGELNSAEEFYRLVCAPFFDGGLGEVFL